MRLAKEHCLFQFHWASAVLFCAWAHFCLSFWYFCTSEKVEQTMGILKQRMRATILHSCQCGWLSKHHFTEEIFKKKTPFHWWVFFAPDFNNTCCWLQTGCQILRLLLFLSSSFAKCALWHGCTLKRINASSTHSHFQRIGWLQLFWPHDWSAAAELQSSKEKWHFWHERRLQPFNAH